MRISSHIEPYNWCIYRPHRVGGSKRWRWRCKVCRRWVIACWPITMRSKSFDSENIVHCTKSRCFDTNITYFHQIMLAQYLICMFLPKIWFCYCNVNRGSHSCNLLSQPSAGVCKWSLHAHTALTRLIPPHSTEAHDCVQVLCGWCIMQSQLQMCRQVCILSSSHALNCIRVRKQTQ